MVSKCFQSHYSKNINVCLMLTINKNLKKEIEFQNI